MSSVQWNPYKKEILTSHSEGSSNLFCWSYPSMTKVKELCGHRKPVVDSAISPTGRKVISISLDDSIRFWNAFDVQAQGPAEFEGSLRNRSTIR